MGDNVVASLPHTHTHTPLTHTQKHTYTNTLHYIHITFLFSTVIKLSQMIVLMLFYSGGNNVASSLPAVYTTDVCVCVRVYVCGGVRKCLYCTQVCVSRSVCICVCLCVCVNKVVASLPTVYTTDVHTHREKYICVRVCVCVCTCLCFVRL
jgi:hypothetical protein